MSLLDYVSLLDLTDAKAGAMVLIIAGDLKKKTSV
jgi:hypothetical protein